MERRIPRLALSMREAADAYGIDRHRLQQAIAAGELPAARLGRRRLRIRVADLDAWLDRYRVTPEPAEDAWARRRVEREARG